MTRTASLRVSPFLRWVLLADAGSCIAMGLLLIFAGNPLATLLNLPVGLLYGATALLIPFGVFVFWLATRPQIPRPLAWTVIIVNALWVLDSVLLVFATDWVEPTVLGYIFVLGQAVAVAVLAELQYVGVRRAATA